MFYAALKQSESLRFGLSLLIYFRRKLTSVLLFWGENWSKTLSSCSSTLLDGFCLCCQSTDSANQVSFNDNQSPSQLMITKSTKFETTEDGGTDGPSPSVLAIIEEINKATANNKAPETH